MMWRSSALLKLSFSCCKVVYCQVECLALIRDVKFIGLGRMKANYYRGVSGIRKMTLRNLRNEALSGEDFDR